MADAALEYQPQAEPAKCRRATVWLLIGITFFGGFLRFWKISQPPLWGDEAATFSRICGSYQDLLDILQFNGFVPLHYELYQWIAGGMPMGARIEHRPIAPVVTRRSMFFRSKATPAPATTQPTTKPVLIGEHPLVAGGIRMTPQVMRFVPAAGGHTRDRGDLFSGLPVIVLSPCAALIAAVFTATSAYMLGYSRDAKMYMHFWLCCTLSVACLLWWLRVRTRLSWLAWVAASVAMCGLHAPGAILLGVELLIFLSRDRQWWGSGLILLAGFLVSGWAHGQTHFFSHVFDERWLVLGVSLLLPIVAFFLQRRRDWKGIVFFLLGLCVILSGIGGYYLKFNRFKQQIDEEGWRDSMLQWVDEYNDGRDGVGLMQYTATAYLYSWEWTMP